MARLVNNARTFAAWKGDGRQRTMISFLEMVQRYPIGAKVSLPGDSQESAKEREIVGYEYYNGTGFLVFGDEERVNVDQLMGERRDKLY